MSPSLNSSLRPNFSLMTPPSSVGLSSIPSRCFDLVSESVLGRKAARTRGPLTGKIWQHFLFLPLSHHLLSALGDSQDPETCARMTHVLRLRQNSHTDERQRSSSQCENFCKVSSPKMSHRCSSWHLSRLWRGGSGGLSGIWGVCCGGGEAKRGPRAWMRASFVGHKALSVLGKAVRMGTPPRAGH